MFRKVSDLIFPVINEDEKVRIKRSLCIMLPAVIAIGLVFGIFFTINSPGDPRKWIIFAASLFTLPSWWLARKNYLRLSALLFVLALWAILSIGVVYSGGGISVGHGGFLLLIFMSGLLLSGRYAFVILLMSIASTTWVIYADSYAQLPESPSSKPVNLWIVFNLYLIVGWAVLSLTMRHVRSVIAKASSELQERMRTEQALRKSQERLDLALSSARMGILDWEIDKDQIHWSHQACEIWDIASPQEANSLEKMIWCIYPGDQTKVRLEIERAFEKRSPNFYIENRIILKSGEICWVSVQGHIYYNTQGMACRMTGTTADITLRKQSEQAILDANHRLNAYTDMLEERSGLLLLGAEVARAATAILNPRALSQQVVELVQKTV
jgi:PAS domain S-box-containing protein